MADRGEHCQAAGATNTSLNLSFRCQLAQETMRYPNCSGPDKLRCLFAVRSSHFHDSIFNRIRTADRAASKYSRNLFPQNRFFHIPTLIAAAPGVHPAKARRIAANIAKLPGAIAR
jgi:hypothetical protein